MTQWYIVQMNVFQWFKYRELMGEVSQHSQAKADLYWGSCPFLQAMMGSEIASASMVIQVVKLHTLWIRFPYEIGLHKSNGAEVLRLAGLPSHSSPISQHSKGSKSPDWLIYQGPPDTVKIIKHYLRNTEGNLCVKKKLSLSNVEIQNNHWQCDCYLSSDKSVLFMI